MQFKIFKKENIIQGISDISFGSIKPTVNKLQSEKRAIKFLKSIGQKNALSQNLIWAKQIFSSNIHICKPEDSGKIIKNVDGFVSNVPGQILTITTADCVPILFYDPENQVVGILHGGRDCLIKGIIENMIKKMALNFKCSLEKILVGIGPHIRICHYWLKEKDYQNLKNTKFKKHFIFRRRKAYFNLTKVALDKLLKLGIKRKNIEDCKICTFCQNKKYFSQRKKEESPKVYKKKEGRFASFIGLKEMEVLKISSKNFEKVMKKAIKTIKEGGVIICPTDTVYGLLGDVSNKKTVEKIFKIKKRIRGKAIPLFVKDIKMAKQLTFINKNQERFLKKVWPGKVTVVFGRKGRKQIYGVDKKTIGLRIPNFKPANYLLEELNMPLVGTSANISGKPASGNIREVLNQFGYIYSHGRIRIPRGQRPRVAQFACPDLIIDAGNLPKSKPSTVLDLTTWPPKILRT